MRGAMRIQPATPITAPITAATEPVAAPLASMVNRRCFSVAPTADIMPSWGSRRWAMTVKLAAAIKPTRKRARMVTTRTSTSAITSSRTSPRADTVRPCAPGGRNELTRSSSAVHEHRHRIRPGQFGWRQQYEVVVEIVGVLDDADDGSLDPVEVDGGPELGADECRDRRCHRGLGVDGRVPAGAQAEHRPTEGPVRVLRPIVHRPVGPGYRHRRVADRVDRAEPLGSGIELRLQRLRIVVLESEEVCCIAELGIPRCRRHVVGRTREPDGGGHRRRQQDHDEQVLAPITTEQPPRPSCHCPAGGHAAVRMPAHRSIAPDSSDSGPAAGIDWSTMRPSRKNTTRSAHDAS